MQDIKRIKHRERESQTQTQGYVSRLEHPAQRRRLHPEGFQLSPLRTLQRIQTKSFTQEEAKCNAPIPRIRGRHCDVYT